MQRVTQLSLWIFVGLLAYAPLHILLSTWFGTSFGVLEFAKVAKDIVMVGGLVLITAAYLKKYNYKQILSDRLMWLIAAYTVLTLLLAAMKPTDSDAEILGVVYNLRFLAFFVYGLLLTQLVPIRRLRRLSLAAVLASSFVVLAFGVLQYAVLSNNALTHVGYSRANGVLPAFFIDDKPDLERIMSTQRDPNSFGSYVLIVVGLAGALWLRGGRERKLSQGFLLLCGLCLWFTFSRSAWIGAVVTMAVLMLLSSKRFRIDKRHVKLGAIGFMVTAGVVLGVVVASWNTYLVQNVILHADTSTTLEDPNELRLRFAKESVHNIVHNPLGTGPGTAGLASIRNNIQGTQLNENYYLQIASEVGVIGLALFLAIVCVVAARLYRRHRTGDWLATALLASLAGLCVTNLLVHIWATEAVAYTWWGLAPLVLLYPWSHAHRPAILKQSAKKP